MKDLIESIVRPHLDASQRKRYNRLYYGDEERAGMTRRRREEKKKNELFEREQAFHKKNKKAYYHPKPVPAAIEEFNAKHKQNMEMYERNARAREKHFKEVKAKMKQRKKK